MAKNKDKILLLYLFQNFNLKEIDIYIYSLSKTMLKLRNVMEACTIGGQKENKNEKENKNKKKKHRGDMVLYMITRDKKYNNLPKDVINSLTKMITIISTIEENLFLTKDDILREINIEIDSLQRAIDVFNQYYPDKRVNLFIYNTEKEN